MIKNSPACLIIITIFLFLMFIPCTQNLKSPDYRTIRGIYAVDKPDDDEPNDAPPVPSNHHQKGKPGSGTPIDYLPRDPQVRKLKLRCMELAEKFTKLIALRAALQPTLANLEKNEAELRHQRLKYRLKYFKLREKFMQKYPQNPKIRDILIRHDAEIRHIDDLIAMEEKIDCYHTIFERKHRAMEEYHWNLIDNKHPLIAEYLSDLDIRKNKRRFITLYNEAIKDYKRIILENKEMLIKTKEIVRGKERREKIMKQVVEELKKLCLELEKIK